MKNLFRGILGLFFVILVVGCASTAGGKYSMVFDRSIQNQFVLSAWMSYAGHIKTDMEKFYKNNPDGDYVISYTTERDARNAMIDFYLRVQKDYALNDGYIEDLIKIRTSNLFNEYVFFSFNPGSWTNEENFLEEKYKEWMKSNLPEHVPVTLARVEKVD